MLLIAAVAIVSAQTQQPPNSGTPVKGIPHDWSHHHVIFSRIDTGDNSPELEQNPRYWHQYYRRNASAGQQQTETAQTASRVARKNSKGLWGESFSGTAAGTVGPGNYPAKWSFFDPTSVSCSDYVAFNTSLPGTTAQPSVVAYDNIYSSCSTQGSVPSLYWAYDTAGTIASSVSISEDGSQLVFLHTPSSGTASVVVLHWHAGDGSVSVPKVLTTQASNTAYANCRSSATQACMYTMPLGNAHNASSSPFYDYGGDNLYVADQSGYLHKFTGIFKGNPAEVTTSPWPVQISTQSTPALTSPIYDGSTTGYILLGDAAGFLYCYNLTGNSIVKSSQLAVTGSKGIVDPPLIDSSVGTVYVLVGQDGNTSTTKNCQNAAGCNGVFGFSYPGGLSSTASGVCSSTTGTGWTSGTNCGKESLFGVGNSTTTLYTGTFDNAYYSSGGGNIWTCAATGTPVPKLSASPVTSSGITTSGSNTLILATNIVNPLASAAATCSPVTEIDNGSIDYIYLSVTANGNQTGCSGACLYGFQVASSVPSATISGGRPAAGGTSGIVIDNTASSGGGSQIYFTFLSQATSAIKCPLPSGASSGGCAVQATQATLQ